MVTAVKRAAERKKQRTINPRRYKTWRSFLENIFGGYVAYGFAPHHVEFWDWVWSLTKGIRPRPFVAIWPRGGAKSSSAELAAAMVGMRGQRRYILYVSETQDLADKHVATIATLLESAGVGRAVNKYGSSKGWRRNRLRAASGFTIDALGLDTASRGIKVDADRPDMMILDDIDARHDTPETVQKKTETLTNTILPAGSADCAVLAVQNLVHRGSIFSKLAEAQPEFLSDRILSGPHPALRDFEFEYREGQPVITRGEPTWEGQDLTACQNLIVTIGPRAFLRECQHDVTSGEGQTFKREWFEVVDELPKDMVRVRYWDLAATVPDPGKDPDWISGCGMGRAPNGVVYIYDMRHDRLSPENVERLVAQTASEDGKLVPVWIEQEPGASGKIVISHFQRIVLAGYEVRGNPATGNKLQRAGALSAAAEAGNVKLLRGGWNKAFLDEAEDFPAVSHDDQIDSADGAYSKVTLNAGELLAQEAKELRERMQRGEPIVIRAKRATDEAQRPEGAVDLGTITMPATDGVGEIDKAALERQLAALWAGTPLNLKGLSPEALAYLERRVIQLIDRAALNDNDNARLGVLVNERKRIAEARK